MCFGKDRCGIERRECVDVTQNEKKNSVCVFVSVCHCVGTSLTAQVGQMETYTNYRLSRTAELLKDLQRHKEGRACKGTMTLENGRKVVTAS